MKNSFNYCFLLLLLFYIPFHDTTGQPRLAREQRMENRAVRKLGDLSSLFAGWHHMGEIRADSIRVGTADNVVSIFFSPPITHLPVRYAWLESLKIQIANRLGFRFRNYEIQLFANERLLEDYIPNYYRGTFLEIDSSRMKKPAGNRPLVVREDRPGYPGGLTGSHLAIWPSHGYHYDAGRDRWEWQRARLFGTIEDLFTFSFIQPYLLPMLENAGAYVFLPRERDLQSFEVIADNDGSSGNSQVIIGHGGENHWETVAFQGFGLKDTLFEGENPFRLGSHLRIRTPESQGAGITYIPDIPEDGEYAVYISWARAPRNVSGVRCRVYHSAGSTTFYLDQTKGAGTWVYLGTFHFFRGVDRNQGSLVLSGESVDDGYITADAVRFGGGMGNIARKAEEAYIPVKWSLHDNQTEVIEQPLTFRRETEWKLSGRPRYMEGARYYLQYSGMPDSTVYSINRGKNDYNDDYMSRGEWVNYLMGARMAGRDLADIIQTQIVSDIRFQVNTGWTRRGLWDRQYSEAWRPQAPAMLLELLSHQNLADMRHGLDPRFRFLVSRSIYKGILRYLAFDQGNEAVIQPLPPAGMAIERTGMSSVRLKWQPVPDPLEPTAGADFYRVYTRRENAGFDSGVEVASRFLDISLSDSGIYSFRVTAVNSGGESMPGEILSVSLRPDDEKPVLIVNAFTRVSAPAFFDEGEMAGTAWWHDQGVADRYDMSHTGVQYDFGRSSPWLDDDSPGWGASYAGMEGKIISGNSFDFPALYGLALRSAGYSFVSASKRDFEQSDYNPRNFKAVIIIFGEERGPGYRLFTPGIINSLGEFARTGGNIFLSGAYIGTDMTENNDSLAISFARDVLGFTWRTNFACDSGRVLATGQSPLSFPANLDFSSGYHPAVYSVEAPDAIEPAGEDAWRIYRYSSSKTSAGIMKNGDHRVIALGFPFESILCGEMRYELMREIMIFFQNNK